MALIAFYWVKIAVYGICCVVFGAAVEKAKLSKKATTINLMSLVDKIHISTPGALTHDQVTELQSKVTKALLDAVSGAESFDIQEKNKRKANDAEIGMHKRSTDESH